MIKSTYEFIHALKYNFVIYALQIEFKKNKILVEAFFGISNYT